MKRFKNKKLATIIIAFLMVFVVAGGFAALERIITLNARVNVFAPLVDIIWADAEVTSYPTRWSGTNRTGLGDPAAHARFAARGANWPTPPDLATDANQYETFGLTAHAFAYWHTAHPGDGQAGPGEFVPEVHIEQGTVLAPVGYRTLNIAMVFDNFDQSYTWEFSMGNPGDIDLVTDRVVVTGYPVPGEPLYYILDNGDDMEALFAPLVGVTIESGDIVSRSITFNAPEEGWVDFFGEPAGIAFLDNNFATPLEANFSVQVISVLP